MARGILYCMSSIVPGLIKIGKTTDYEKRMYVVEHNGYVNITGFRRAYAIEVDDFDEKESQIKKDYQKVRIGNTELFAMNIDRAIQILSSFDGVQVYPDPKIESKKSIQSKANTGIESSDLPDGEYYLKSKGLSAILSVENGILTLKKGSDISQNPVPSFYTGRNKKNPVLWEEISSQYVVDGKLIDDIVVSDVSTAACIVTASSKNGWLSWKTKAGKEIGSLRKTTKIKKQK